MLNRKKREKEKKKKKNNVATVPEPQVQYIKHKAPPAYPHLALLHRQPCHTQPHTHQHVTANDQIKNIIGERAKKMVLTTPPTFHGVYTSPEQTQTAAHHAHRHPKIAIYKSINGSSTFCCAGAACGADGKLSGPYPPIAYGVAGFQLLCCCGCCGGACC